MKLNARHKKRLFYILALIAGLGLALGLILMALNRNINLYFTPTQIVSGEAPYHHSLRVGGMVKRRSIKHDPHSLQVAFTLTDFKHQVRVHYTGILPALFREGQGIVVQGVLTSDGEIKARQVLAKHDEKYMPPNIHPRSGQAS